MRTGSSPVLVARCSRVAPPFRAANDDEVARWDRVLTLYLRDLLGTRYDECLVVAEVRVHASAHESMASHLLPWGMLTAPRSVSPHPETGRSHPAAVRRVPAKVPGAHERYIMSPLPCVPHPPTRVRGPTALERNGFFEDKFNQKKDKSGTLWVESSNALDCWRKHRFILQGKMLYHYPSEKGVGAPTSSSCCDRQEELLLTPTLFSTTQREPSRSSSSPSNAIRSPILTGSASSRSPHL